MTDKEKIERLREALRRHISPGHDHHKSDIQNCANCQNARAALRDLDEGAPKESTGADAAADGLARPAGPPVAPEAGGDRGVSVVGVGRDAENARSLVLYLDGEPTDDELRLLHRRVRGPDRRTFTAEEIERALRIAVNSQGLTYPSCLVAVEFHRALGLDSGEPSAPAPKTFTAEEVVAIIAGARERYIADAIDPWSEFDDYVAIALGLGDAGTKDGGPQE